MPSSAELGRARRRAREGDGGRAVAGRPRCDRVSAQSAPDEESATVRRIGVSADSLDLLRTSADPRRVDSYRGGGGRCSE